MFIRQSRYKFRSTTILTPRLPRTDAQQANPARTHTNIPSKDIFTDYVTNWEKKKQNSQRSWLYPFWGDNKFRNNPKFPTQRITILLLPYRTIRCFIKVRAKLQLELFDPILQNNSITRYNKVGTVYQKTSKNATAHSNNMPHNLPNDFITSGYKFFVIQHSTIPRREALPIICSTLVSMKWCRCHNRYRPTIPKVFIIYKNTSDEIQKRNELHFSQHC